MKLFKKIYEKYFGPGTTFYTILKPCRRCVYQKSHEPILIISRDRGPRIIILEGSVYLRTGQCTGYTNCGRCFEAISGKSYKCEWIKM